MSIDLSQFSQIFFEEALENIAVMETQLLAINSEQIDPEIIHTIFRAAHSIKGGSATFGFTEVANFTHLIETLLDEVREGVRHLQTAHIEMLLQSVDIIRAMVGALMDNQPYQSEQLTKLISQFEQVLAIEHSQNKHHGEDDLTHVEQSSNNLTLWQIEFVPGHDILQRGNDPSFMFTELAQLGQCHISLNDIDYPNIDALDPEVCLLQWQITLLTKASLPRIKEVFEWVEAECQLRYQSLARDPLMERSLFNHANTDGQATASGQHKLSATQYAASFAEQNDDTHCMTNSNEIDDINASNNANFDFSQAVADALNECQQQSPPNHQPSEHPPKPSTISAQSNHATNQASAKPIVTTELNDVSHQPSTTSNSLLSEIAPFTHSQPQPLAAPTPKPKPAPPTPKNTESSTSIRVGSNKVDQLMNMVGELVITQSMLDQLGQQDSINGQMMHNLRLGLEQLSSHTRQLQQSVMKIRMMPISFAFNRFPRLIHDISKQLGKKVELTFRGEETELDKTVMEKVIDPLVHLVRNALDHGIESPKVRRQAGKPEMGTIALSAYHRSEVIVIEISDDGAGLPTEKIRQTAIEKGLIQRQDNLSDNDINQLIFHPGFTTTTAVSNLSGRGVGMDVVKRNINALNGRINLHSTQGEGCKVSINLPLTLSILDGQLVRIGQHVYVVPLMAIHESLQVQPQHVNQLGDNQQVLHLRDEFIPLINVFQQFNHQPDSSSVQDGIVMVVDNNNSKVGLLFDELLAQQQVVIKSLEDNYQKTAGISGATILGDGTVALIIDVNSLTKLAGIGKNKDHAA
ncbi:chemotaxis protein CheA [Shewanella intestini]|uniref:Chemotaxis protein CheA n=1 Tax=Shewanella intestini TaxID=2017544 RepID=A0ABS5I217_9GAMM|nr:MULTISPECIES: chemotaxis protein CheA [Shewanella]MBR9728070.1 chemotaxis protein CheA [Shewanella intestini]MRG36542.1 chemotaxis protein CheA [Shewanella sp. XMDDZSB0408]